MSKDIRSFFKIKGAGTKPKTTSGELKSHEHHLTALSDEDVIPESPNVGVRVKDRKSKKRQIIDDDSDEEIFGKKSKTSSSTIKKSEDKNTVPKTPILKEVKASDIFGTGPIKRTPVGKKSKQNGDVKIKNESDVHLDAEFNKTLSDIDVATNHKSSEKANVLSIKSEKATHDVQKSLQKSKSDGSSHKYEKKSKVLESKEVASSKTKMEEEKAQDTSNKSANNIKHNSSSSEKSTNSLKKETSTTLDSEVKVRSESNEKSCQQEKQSDMREKSNNKSKKEDSNKNNKSISEVKDEHSCTGKSRSSPKKKQSPAEVKLPSRSEVKCSKQDADGNLCGTSKASKKRDFSEFLNQTQGESTADESFSSTPSQVKKKIKNNQTLNESVISDEERYERKRHSAVLYQKYLNRTGPKNLGSKEIPEGKADCLKNMIFLLTGVLESFEREEIVDVIKKYGGEVKSGISKKVTHVLAGEDAGPSKVSKAEELGITILDEDQFLELICPKARNQNGVHSKGDENSKNHKSKSKTTQNGSSKSDLISKKSSINTKIEAVALKISPKKEKVINEELNTQVLNGDSLKSKTIEMLKLENNKSDSSCKSIESMAPKPEYSLAWVDKYKPQTLKQIIGQHGAASNVSKLVSWLRNWSANRKKKLPKPSPWAKNDDGGYFKAALLSGPPGVGKTTTVSLVCKELDLDTVELNASDTRSKSLIKQQISELLTTKSLAGYVHGKSGKQAVTKEHVLVMDEVDGMAGNEDRGGLQELISLIKISSVPIVCMCNDRNSPKMRSLVNYCYDLRFSRPQVPQIKAAMMSVCFKEGLKIPGEALTQVITAANQDVRQTLNLLCMWSASSKLNGDPNNKVQKTKDIKLGSWEVVRKVFSADEQAGMSIHDKSDLFFHDYSIAPLFVQENYLHVAPKCHKSDVLRRVSVSADSLSIGDLVEAKIRGRGAWGLLPVQAMYSSVIPGHAMAGHMAGQIQFPAWLGKNSRSNKMHRLAQEIHSHTRLSTSGSKEAVYLDYAMHLRDGVARPLAQDRTEGVCTALALLQAYHLTREDLDSLTELSLWPGQKDPMLMVDSKVKAAMTRAYNKEAAPLPYAPGVAKRRAIAREDNTEEGEEGEEEENVSEDDNVDNDGLIKKKKPAVNKEAGSSRSRTKKSK